MFLGMPFYILIAPLSAYLFAIGREKILRNALFVLILSLVLSLAAGGLAVCFAAGSISFVLAVLGMYYIRPSAGAETTK